MNKTTIDENIKFKAIMKRDKYGTRPSDIIHYFNKDMVEIYFENPVFDTTINFDNGRIWGQCFLDKYDIKEYRGK